MTALAVLVVAEHDNAGIKPATLNTVTAATQCGGDVHVLVAGLGAEAAAKAAAAIAPEQLLQEAPAPTAEPAKPAKPAGIDAAALKAQLTGDAPAKPAEDAPPTDAAAEEASA